MRARLQAFCSRNALTAAGASARRASRTTPAAVPMQPAAATGTAPERRVLAVQSHVVSGYVGNKCAVFPLQLHGWLVDPIMSVHFSNHTGYPTIRGTKMNGEDLTGILEGLRANGLLQHTHVLTGYIGTEAFLREVVQVVKELRQGSPGLCYVCDPVLGDEGRLYVPEELIRVYQDEVVPQASVLTPNQFELELLTGKPVNSVEGAMQGCDALHEKGVQTVIVTSMNTEDNGKITLLGSTVAVEVHGPRKFTLSVPKVAGYFTGTGDLLAALLLVWLTNLPGCVAAAVENALASLQVIVHDTADHAGPAALSKERNAAIMHKKELRLVQNQNALLRPEIVHRAVEYQSNK